MDYRLRWQVYQYLTGYDYKNSIANGCFFNLGARLARYTGNDTYAQHAESIWSWTTGVGYIDENYNIYDGAHVETNCTDINKVQFSYNPAVWLLGAANMYNYVFLFSYLSFSSQTSTPVTNIALDKWKRNLGRKSQRPPEPNIQCLLPRRHCHGNRLRTQTVLYNGHV
jgi:hypothetical protein